MPSNSRSSGHSLEKLIRDFDRLIREGRTADVRKGLGKLKQSDIVPKRLAEIANLAWRAGDPALGIRLLHARVRTSSLATDLERAEYATCLVRIGALEEAAALLASIDVKKCPRALAYQAAIHLGHWEYAEAIPLLQKYLKSDTLSAYDKLVGRTNLAACLVHEHERKASMLLSNLLYEGSLRRLHLLYGHCLQLAAENAVYAKKWSAAEDYLAIAARLLDGGETREEFYVVKWRAIARLRRGGPTPAALSEISRVREQAGKREHWETQRDCDRFRALATKDQALLKHLYFGTPFSNFRARLVEESGSPLDKQPHFFWEPAGNSQGPTLDVYSGEMDNGSALKPGSMLHRLLGALTSDFYRPFRIASLFSSICPGEHYNPLSSPRRVHQSIDLLREWLVENKFPLEIRESSRAYRFVPTGPCRVKRQEISKTLDRRDVYFSRLREGWGDRPFSRREAEQCLKISSRSCMRALDDGVKAGTLAREGRGTMVRYRFRDTIKKAS